MSLNLKKLQSKARRRIGLKGSFEFKTVPKSQIQAFKFGTGFLSTITNSTLAHIITYSDPSSLDSADLFHEFCRAKLNECGFTTIEAAALNAMRDCSKEDPKYIRDANSAFIIISEVYTSHLLFSNFKQESDERRESIVLR
ncbi:MAG TPA: hypothetical protein VJN71_02900, partial [Nitrososphaerales archaeon]|nr:hypothetical protein [Nitrososphaerales archaeon]